jgi:hypothetical protein
VYRRGDGRRLHDGPVPGFVHGTVAGGLLVSRAPSGVATAPRTELCLFALPA